MNRTPTKTGQNGKRRARDAEKPAVRVAVYARQSLTEGREGQFGSLQAQEESIAAYVTSRREEGWEVTPNAYVDRDATGANLDRPALQRLLADVEAGHVDAIGVYKLDRLSRRQIDLLRILEYLDLRGVKFFAVTQNFDTSSSMGRCMLNIMGAFAQLEREVIAERTSDTMCAARRRGLWTGGHPPLGYDLVDKCLVVNEAEAQVVRLILRLYLELGGLVAVATELAHRGILTKTWTTKKGTLHEGRPFTKSLVRQLLVNPIYAGMVRCKGENHPGEHEAIVGEAMWDAVQAQLAQNANAGGRARSVITSPLSGLVRCAVCGSGMTTTHARKGQTQYYYYACQRAQKQGASACPGSRVAVGELESFVLDRIRVIGRDPELLTDTVEAAHDGLRARQEELQSEIARLEGERSRLDADRKRHEETAAKGGRGAPAVRARLREIEKEIAATEVRLSEVRREHAALDGQEVDDAELASLLERFDPLWDELFPHEKSRVLRLLIDEVRVDAPAGEVEIVFRPGGIRTLTEEVNRG